MTKGNKMGKKLYGNIKTSNVNYEWNTEPGACETCKKLNGKIFDQWKRFRINRIQTVNAG